MPGHGQRLLEPNTEENRIAPWEGACGAGVGNVGGGGGSLVGGGRSYVVRCCAAGRAAPRESVAVAVMAARVPPPSLRDDIRL